MDYEQAEFICRALENIEDKLASIDEATRESTKALNRIGDALEAIARSPRL